MMKCNCCLQTQVENIGPAISVLEGNIEDGDVLQEIGNAQYTLEFLRQIVQQSARIIDESPPAYEDFDKYPTLSKYQTPLKDSTPVKPCTQQPRQFAQREFDQFVNASTVSWREPYPKPQGDPPPAMFNWLLNRFDSFRQSIMSRLSNQSNQNRASSVFSTHSESNFVVSSPVSLPRLNSHPEPSNSLPPPIQSTEIMESNSSQLTNNSKVTRSPSSTSEFSTISIDCTTNDGQHIITVTSASPNHHQQNNNQAAESSCIDVLLQKKSVIEHDSDIEQVDTCQTDSQNDNYNVTTNDEINQSVVYD
ncbi:unnamed protein product [Schistosoma turkestanicum]|nr:unnamed protein product [Schistosoma turkestanicum]